MDPEYQHDATFAQTLAGIEDLRSKYQGEENDWNEWKRMLIKGMRSGERLEREFQDVKREVALAARAAAVAKAFNRIELLEKAEESRKSIGVQVAKFAAQIVVGGILVYLGHLWK